MGERDDAVIAEKRFLEKFSECRAALAAEEESVQYRIGSPLVAQHDFEGEVTDWALQYLYAHKCPYNLAAAVAYATCQEVKSSDLQSVAHQNGQADGEIVFDSNKLLRLVHWTVHDICERWMATPTKAVLPPTWPVAITAVKNGRRRMEDRHVVISDLGLLCGVECPSPRGFFAVFDGHAGPDAATYAAAHLHHNIVRQPTFVSNIVQAIKDGFQLTDEHFIYKSKQENLKSGSTAVCAIVEDISIHVAWLGDSQAILARQGGILNLVTPHKPERADERERIESLGGCVILFGTWRVNGTLAVSRAIGDAEFKPYVSAEPDVVSIPRDGTEDFLIVACDGLWDVMTGDDAANIVYAYLVKKPDDLEGAAHKLVQVSVSRGSNDNISVIIVLLRGVAEIVASMSCIPESPPESFRIPLASNESLPEGLKQMIENGESPTKILPLPDMGIDEQFSPGPNTLNPFAPSFTPSSARNGPSDSLSGGDLLNFCDNGQTTKMDEPIVAELISTEPVVHQEEHASSDISAHLWISDTPATCISDNGNVPTDNLFSAANTITSMTTTTEFHEYFLAQRESQVILDGVSTIPSEMELLAQSSALQLSSFDSKPLESPSGPTSDSILEPHILSLDMPVGIEGEHQFLNTVPTESLPGESPLILPSPPTIPPTSPGFPVSSSPPPIPERPKSSAPPMSPPATPKSPSQIPLSPPPIPARSPDMGLPLAPPSTSPPPVPVMSPPPIPARSPQSICTPPRTPSTPPLAPAPSPPFVPVETPPPIPAVSPLLPASPPPSSPHLPASPPPVLAASPMIPASPPPIPVASPQLPASPPPVFAESPVLPASPPPIPAASPKLPTSPSPVLATSPVLPSSPPPIPAASPMLPASPPPVLAASPVIPASPPLIPAASPPLLDASLGQQVQFPPSIPAASPPPVPTRSPTLPSELPLSPPLTSPTSPTRPAVTSSPVTFESAPPLDISVQQFLLNTVVDVNPQSSSVNDNWDGTLNHQQTAALPSESVPTEPVTVESIPETVPVSEDVVDDESEDGEGWRYFQVESGQSNQKGEPSLLDSSLHSTSDVVSQKEESLIIINNSSEVIVSSSTHISLESSKDGTCDSSLDGSGLAEVCSQLINTSSEAHESSILTADSSTKESSPSRPQNDDLITLALSEAQSMLATTVDTSINQVEPPTPPASAKGKDARSTESPKVPKEKVTSGRETLKKMPGQVTKDKRPIGNKSSAPTKPAAKVPATAAKVPPKASTTQTAKPAAAAKTLERKPQVKSTLPPARTAASSSSVAPKLATRPSSATTRRESGSTLSRPAPGTKQETNVAGTLPKRPASAGTLPRTGSAPKPLSNGVKKTSTSAKPAAVNEAKSTGDSNVTAKTSSTLSRSVTQTKTSTLKGPTRPPATKKSAPVPGAKSDTVLITTTANKETKDTVNKQISTTVRQTSKTTVRLTQSSRSTTTATTNGTSAGSRTARVPGPPAKEAVKKVGSATLPSSVKGPPKKTSTTVGSTTARKAPANTKLLKASSSKESSSAAQGAGTSTAAKGVSSPSASRIKTKDSAVLSEKGALDEQAKEPPLAKPNDILDHGDELGQIDGVLAANGSVVDSLVGLGSGDTPAVVSTQEMV